WVSEVESLSEEEREEFEQAVRPVKMALVKIRKFTFKIVNSSTKLLPAWRAVTAEMKLPNRLLPRDVRTHWNSMYDMLNEGLTFRPAIDKMTDDDEEYGLAAFRLKKREWRLMEQLHDVLKLSDLSATYRIAMILHPQYKLRYFEDAGWPKHWIDNAREMLEEQYSANY
ncbi:hypothetical protein LXA43DRAFT_836592, partial [Ganoderma leucocontextum]